MLEYASMRLMLRCSSAVTLPTVMVSAASIHRTLLQSAASGDSVCRKTRANAANAAALMPTAINAVTAVGEPS